MAKLNKSEYVEPQITITLFKSEDVITTSGDLPFYGEDDEFIE